MQINRISIYEGEKSTTVLELEGNRPLGRPGHRLEININFIINVKEY